MNGLKYHQTILWIFYYYLICICSSLLEAEHLHTKHSINRKHMCDKSTEFTCASHSKHANTVECIKKHHRCDGYYDCTDNSDENHCPLLLNYHISVICFNTKIKSKYSSSAIYNLFEGDLFHGEISIAPAEYLQCDIHLRNITNV